LTKKEFIWQLTFRGMLNKSIEEVLSWESDYSLLSIKIITH